MALASGIVLIKCADSNSVFVYFIAASFSVRQDIYLFMQVFGYLTLCGKEVCSGIISTGESRDHLFSPESSFPPAHRVWWLREF